MTQDELNNLSPDAKHLPAGVREHKFKLKREALRRAKEMVALGGLRTPPESVICSKPFLRDNMWILRVHSAPRWPVHKSFK